MHEMSRDEWRAFLLEGTRTAKLATTRNDGRPHVSPIWFLLDGDALVFTTHETSIKGKAIRRDPNVSVFPGRARFARRSRTQLAVRGPGDPAPCRWMADPAFPRGERRALVVDAQHGARNGVPGELLVRVTPSKILARAGIAD